MAFAHKTHYHRFERNLMVCHSLIMNGVQVVAGSNPATPTTKLRFGGAAT